MKYQQIIGIDAGKHTGLAIYNAISKKLTDLQTVDFWRAYELITRFYDSDSTLVVIENPNLIKAVFIRGNIANARAQSKLSQNVGSVKRETGLLAEGLRRAGFTVEEVQPVRSKIKDSKYFNKLTRWEGRTSQHARDAAMLVIGR